MSEQIDWQKLSGDWHNQLGSKMTLIADENGGLRGKYNSAVGQAEDFYILTGRFDACPPSDEGVSLGWVVSFSNRKLNEHCSTTWSGQYFDGGDERILTRWVLNLSIAPNAVCPTNIGHDIFTRVGLDTFTRNKPNTAEIAKAQALTGPGADGRFAPVYKSPYL